MSCPSCCELLSGSHCMLALFSTSAFGPSWGSQRARSDLAQLFSCWGFRYGLGRAMLEWVFFGYVALFHAVWAPVLTRSFSNCLPCFPA